MVLEQPWVWMDRTMREKPTRREENEPSMRTKEENNLRFSMCVSARVYIKLLFRVVVHVTTFGVAAVLRSAGLGAIFMFRLIAAGVNNVAQSHMIANHITRCLYLSV